MQSITSNQKGRRAVLWTVGIAIVLVALHYLINYICDCGPITLWDWLKLLIVPGVIAVSAAIGGAWFAGQRAQDDALQAYLDQMSQMLTDTKHPLHRSQPGDILSTVARAR